MWIGLSSTLSSGCAPAPEGGRAGVPPEVALALGSAYFNMGALPDAEREFKGALVADPENGDAQNNLAVVYMLTGRLGDAERAIEEAEKRGVPVDPRLKEELRKRKSTPSAP